MEAVIKRERWVEHLQRRAEHTAETCNKVDTSAGCIYFRTELFFSSLGGKKKVMG